MKNNYIQIQTTFEKRGEALEFAERLLAAKLVADGQISEIFSIYNFENKGCSHQEFLLTMKTKAELFGKCEEFIKERHKYKVPQIIAVPIKNGSKDYLDWITKSTKI